MFKINNKIGVKLIFIGCAAVGGCDDASNPSKSQQPMQDPSVFQTFQTAGVVIGQADFLSHDFNQGGVVDANTLDAPEGRPTIGSLYIPDTGNSRVLGFNVAPVNNNELADFVLGKTDFTSSDVGTSSTPILVATRSMDCR